MRLDIIYSSSTAPQCAPPGRDIPCRRPRSHASGGVQGMDDATLVRRHILFSQFANRTSSKLRLKLRNAYTARTSIDSPMLATAVRCEGMENLRARLIDANFPGLTPLDELEIDFRDLGVGNNEFWQVMALIAEELARPQNNCLTKLDVKGPRQLVSPSRDKFVFFRTFKYFSRLESLSLVSIAVDNDCLDALIFHLQRPYLRHLKLRDNELEPGATERLCSALADSVLISLEISRNTLDKEDLWSLGNAISSLATLNKLVLSDNQSSDAQGIAGLLLSLRNSSVIELDVRGASYELVDETVLSALEANTSIRIFRMGDSRDKISSKEMKPEIATRLGARLQRMQALSFANQPESALDALLATNLLDPVPDLHFDFFPTRGDSDALLEASKLLSRGGPRRLRLRLPHVSTSGIENLSRLGLRLNQTIRELDLSECLFGPEGTRVLLAHGGLTKRLEKLTFVTTELMNFPKDFLGTEECALDYLRLEVRRWKSAPARGGTGSVDDVALADALRRNNTIKTFHLGLNPFTEHVISEVVAALSREDGVIENVRVNCCLSSVASWAELIRSSRAISYLHLGCPIFPAPILSDVKILNESIQNRPGWLPELTFAFGRGGTAYAFPGARVWSARVSFAALCVGFYSGTTIESAMSALSDRIGGDGNDAIKRRILAFLVELSSVTADRLSAIVGMSE